MDTCAQVNGHVTGTPSNGSTATNGPTAEGQQGFERANEEEEAALRREIHVAAERQFVLLTNLIAVGQPSVLKQVSLRSKHMADREET